MSISPVLHRAAGFCFVVAFALSALAVETHVWNQSDQADYSRGTVKNLSVRSDGHVTLAPETRELDSTSVPYLWALAQDSKGTVYYGGGAPTGATARVFALPPGGKPKVLSEIAGLEIHALAVDKQDRLYVAVLPDAKVYRIDGNGKAQLFYDPKCKYIWAMAFDSSGNLFVATGDSGLIFKVTPDGHGSKFADTEETHARSLIIDGNGNLIVGTEPGGLVLRITPAGQSFVLFQTSRREVTALGEHEGLIYAASVGSKTQAAVVSGPAPVLPSTTPPVTGAGTPRSGTAPPSLPPSVGSLSAAVVGGSEVVRIQKDGYAERIWSSPTELAYALAFDAAGKPLVGTGNRGIIYRLDSDQLSTQLVNIPPTQITTFLPGLNRTLYVATGNVGNLYAVNSNLQAKGTFTSEVLDAREFSYWGKIHLTPTLPSGAYTVETRSGNLNNPETAWSPWSALEVPREGGQISSPASRFLQYRLTLNRLPNGQSPDLSAVDVAYQAKNVAPKVTLIEVAPANYKQSPTASTLERSVQPSGSPNSLSLPAVGQRRAATATNLEVPTAATLQYAKGFVTLRWNATDANADPLTFKVEMKSKAGGSWRLLKDKTSDRFFTFDGAAFPDGDYIPRITVNDSDGNIAAEALSSSLEGDALTIDNSPPEILDLKAAESGSMRTISFTAKDALSWIDKAEYSLNGSQWTALSPVNRVTDSQTLSYRFQIEPGHTVSVRVFDEDDNVVVKQVP